MQLARPGAESEVSESTAIEVRSLSNTTPTSVAVSRRGVV